MKFKTIQELFQKELNLLFGKEEISTFFYTLLESYSGIKAFTLALEPQLNASKEQEELFFKALSKLKAETPIQQILGKTSFCDLEFEINEDVLIPRPETEELVHWIINDFNKETKTRHLKILDIGTGSGCIAISLAKFLPEAMVTAIDVSEKALEIAQKNANRNEVEITFFKKDIFTVNDLEDKYDIIVSNPPYVREAEKDTMKKNVLNYEPHLALFVKNENPLLFYKKITALTVNNLTVGGVLYFEINQYLSSEVTSLLDKNHFSDIKLRKDIFDNDRMIRAVKE